jgi:transposase
MPAPHPPEFRQRAVELARLRDKPIREIAQDLGISESCLRHWLAQADIGAGRREGLTSDEGKELVALRKEKRRLEVENEILRRAAAYFAREDVLQNDLPGRRRAGRRRHRHGDGVPGAGCVDVRVPRLAGPAGFSAVGDRSGLEPHHPRDRSDVPRQVRGAAGVRRAGAGRRGQVWPQAGRPADARRRVAGVFRRRRHGCTVRDPGASPSHGPVQRRTGHLSNRYPWPPPWTFTVQTNSVPRRTSSGADRVTVSGTFRSGGCTYQERTRMSQTRPGIGYRCVPTVNVTSVRARVRGQRGQAYGPMVAYDVEAESRRLIADRLPDRPVQLSRRRRFAPVAVDVDWRLP